MLISTCQQIADNTRIGKNFDGIIADLLGVKANRHIIFYRTIAKDTIEITRILHERMDIKNQLGE